MDITEFKTALENLNAALFVLQEDIAEVEKTKEEFRLKEIKREEIDAEQKKKGESLNERETNVKHIESIVDFANEAKEKMAKARQLVLDANEKQTILDRELKKIADDRKKLEKEYEDKEVLRKKEAEALKTERRDLEKKQKDFKITQKIAEETNK